MIYPIRTIVAGVADGVDDDAVLGPAIALAERTGAALHLVHAFELPVLLGSSYAQVGYMSTQALREHAEAIRSRMEERVRALTTRDRIRCRAIAGPAAPAVHEVALREQADLILVGATRRGPVARTILGTAAQRVLRGAPAPVLVLRHPLPPRLRRVLLTTDLSPLSAGVHETALDVLETLLGGEEPEVHSLLVVWHGSEIPAPLRRPSLEQHARGELAGFLDKRRARAIPVAGVVRFGDPGWEVTAAAAEWRPDLLVLGTHGRPAPQRWLLGSIAEETVRRATTNVLVIPSPVEERRVPPVPREGEATAAAPAP